MEALKDSAEEAFLCKDYVRAVSDFTRASALVPDDAELAKALEQARTLLGAASPPKAAMASSVRTHTHPTILISREISERLRAFQAGAGGPAATPQQALRTPVPFSGAQPRTPFSPEQELLVRTATFHSNNSIVLNMKHY